MLLRSSHQTTRRRVVIIIIEIFVFLAIYFGLRAWLQRDMVAGPAPEIEIVDMDGKAISLQNYLGKPVLVHFWATWCRVCRLEQGAINSVSAKWPVIAVAMQSGTDEQVRHFMQKNGLDWTTINDESGVLADRYGVTGVPASFILDENSNIHSSESGYTTSLGLKFRLWLADKF